MIVVRPATSEEAPRLAEIGLAAWRKGVGPLVPPAIVTRIEAENPFVPFLRSMGPRVLVAEIDSQAAGLGASEQDDDTISDIWVAPEFEGRGAGSALIGAWNSRSPRAATRRRGSRSPPPMRAPGDSTSTSAIGSSGGR